MRETITNETFSSDIATDVMPNRGNSQPKYKRVNIHWGIMFILVGTYVFLIFAYIHQWGNNPIPTISSLIFFGVVFFGGLILSGYCIVIIDDNLVVFANAASSLKIPVDKIKEVSIKKCKLFPEKNIERFGGDIVRQVVNIQLKNGKTYEICIKNAEKIKEEIEKRFLTIKHIHPCSKTNPTYTS